MVPDKKYDVKYFEEENIYFEKNLTSCRKHYRFDIDYHN